jgi:hypothetical protein
LALVSLDGTGTTVFTHGEFSPKAKKDFFVVFWSAERALKHQLRSKPSIHVRLRGKIKMVWFRSEDPVSKYGQPAAHKFKQHGVDFDE